MRDARLAIVGATGLVGQELLQLIEETQFPFGKLWLAASPASEGHTFNWKNNTYILQSPSKILENPPHIAFFSAGRAFATQWARVFADTGAYVLDNSPAWRMNPSIPLIVPEINIHHLRPEHKIIANPNCVAIQIALALYPLHQKFTLKRLVASTYQSVSGAGRAALERLYLERKGNPTPPAADPLDLNIIPQIGPIDQAGHAEEERKIVQELHKILTLSDVPITVTCVRVPVARGHAVSLYATFEKSVRLFQAQGALRAQAGITLHNDETPLTPLRIQHQNSCFVSRLRIASQESNALHLWIAADNMRTGAAWNALQIMTHILARHPQSNPKP